MIFPRWAPQDLVATRAVLVQRCKRDEIRRKEHRERYGEEIDNSGMEKATELGEYPVFFYLPSYSDRLAILDKLITHPAMEELWRKLLSGRKLFKPSAGIDGVDYIPDASLIDTNSRSIDLFLVCIDALFEWNHLPKITPTQNQKLLLDIAKSASELRIALLKIKGFERFDMWDVNTLLTKLDYECMADAFTTDEQCSVEESHAMQLAIQSLDFFPRIPSLLDRLSNKAKELSIRPKGVMQPNCVDAQANHFARFVSHYFVSAYGQPLHSYVVIIANTICNSNFTEANIRALVRIEKRHVAPGTRKKIAKRANKING